MSRKDAQEEVQATGGCTASCPCMEPCPLQTALKQIGGKWKILILCALFQDGTTRYNQLKRKLQGITNTMLASSLRALEQDGLISRQLYDERPVRVEYTLRPAANALLPILGQLAEWGAGQSGSHMR